MNHDDDLTASHWDDVVSPNSNIMDPEFNAFNELSVKDEESNDEEEDTNTNDTNTNTTNTNTTTTNDTTTTARSELDQMHELRREERQEHRSELLDQLADKNDSFGDNLELSVVSPTRTDGQLFGDDKSPVKVKSGGSKSSTKSGKLFKRPRKFAASTNVNHLNQGPEADTLGPLGTNDTVKDSESLTSGKEELVKEAEAPLYSLDQEQKPSSSQVSPTKKDTLPPTPKPGPEDGANQLDITVSDPMKVGDITNAHIVYTITTKNKNLDVGKFPKQQEPVTVMRRYKDFRWIYHQLQNNHLGKIIPPPPTKQTYIGRFNESFIENRRLSLEKMLNKINHIGELSNDEDFIMFLISEDFSNQAKERERISGSGASLQNNDALDNDSGNDSIIDNPIAGSSSGGSNGFMSSLFSMSNKIDEPEEYFEQKRLYVENLEVNLKNFYRAIEVVINQRIDIVNIINELTIAIDELSGLEVSKSTTSLLLAFNDVQLKLRDNMDRVNLQDHLTLGFTIEEYLRTIGSIKFVFDKRLKIYQQYQNLNGDLLKKKSQLNKSKLKNQVDKINILTFEIDKLTSRTTNFEKMFNTISDTIKIELEKFEFEKIDDFRNSVEIFIESSIESQKESIELWETFYERQNLSTY